MKVKNSWKRVIAGMLAVLVMAATVPANTDFSGLFGGSSIVASAETAQSAEVTLDFTGEVYWNILQAIHQMRELTQMERVA